MAQSKTKSASNSSKASGGGDDRAKALELTRAQIEKQFGKGSIMLLGDSQIYDNFDAISTGSLALDIALGIGGLPKGRVVEIYGPEGSGKTTVALSVIANCQKQGGTAAFVDAEHALDVAYAAKLGVDVENLLVSQVHRAFLGFHNEVVKHLLGLGGRLLVNAKTQVDHGVLMFKLEVPEPDT